MTAMRVNRRPANAAHRRELCVDAIAALDMDAIHALVCRYSATVDDIAAAAAQTERSADELSAALRDWLADQTPKPTAAEVNRLVNALTQPSLMTFLEA